MMQELQLESNTVNDSITIKKTAVVHFINMD